MVKGWRGQGFRMYHNGLTLLGYLVAVLHE